ncbi:replicative DNA helicase [Microlunatus elymi]|nr:replicative DNA helicase [Microlunatus elymi]
MTNVQGDSVSLAEVNAPYGDEDVRSPRSSAGDRTPPQDLIAEQSVLGAMLMSKDAIADVVEVLRGPDFYRPAHELVYDAVLDLYGRGEPADAVTVAAELTRRGEIARVGGAPYLHDLLASTSIAANAGYYAEIVREKAILRRLADASIRIGQMSYAAEGDVNDIVDRAQAEVYSVTDKRTSEDYKSLSELMQPTMDEIEAIGSRGGQLAGVPTGFADLDDLTNGMHPGQMIIVAARPGMGKSTLGLDLARAASIKSGLTSAIFSLEMSQIEIVMRLLSAEAQIPLNHIRNGKMNDDDWQRMAKKMGEVAEAPLFIDDSPNLTMMEIRAKARRLRQRHELKLIIIDYLQLLTSGKKVESRQVEVSEFSRQLKLLAKELELPVVALAQLNRGPETRGGDKKPMLSDLRESGCLTASTRIQRADTGAEVTLGELMNGGITDIPVWSLDEHLRLVPRTMTHAFPSGTKEVFRLRLTSGREVEATANHPFLTYQGWQPLAELAPGSRLAVPRTLPTPLHVEPHDTDEIKLLAHLLGDGSFVRRQPIRHASTDEANLDESGLFGLRSHERFVPDWVFKLPTPQIRIFIEHLWATDGSVRWDARAGQGRIHYASTSRRLTDDLARLLLRCGILTRIKTVKKAGYRDGYHLIINGVDQQLRFCNEIGVHGARSAQVAEVRARLRSIEANTNVDTIPTDVWLNVKQVLTEQSTTHRQVATAMDTSFCGSTMWKHAPSRQRLARVADLLHDQQLHLEASNDVFWDEVAAIESLGRQPVYDATVLGTHNFVANGISVHNSLEQDADMVILLNRPDIYDKESERAGEADFDVAKHRNGPTKTITVAFQGHYSRFIDMHQ